jgi:hypothetical protein
MSYMLDTQPCPRSPAVRQQSVRQTIRALPELGIGESFSPIDNAHPIAEELNGACLKGEWS